MQKTICHLLSFSDEKIRYFYRYTLNVQYFRKNKKNCYCQFSVRFCVRNAPYTYLFSVTCDNVTTKNAPRNNEFILHPQFSVTCDM